MRTLVVVAALLGVGVPVAAARPAPPPPAARPASPAAGSRPASQPGPPPASQPGPPPASQPGPPPASPAAGSPPGSPRAAPLEPPPDEVFETEVVGRPPLSRDRTQSETRVSGQRVRDSARASTFGALAQEAGDVYVPAGGVGLHGVANGATGGLHIRGLGGSPNSEVLVVEDGVPDYQGIFGHPIPDAYVPFLLDDVLVIKGGDSVLYGTNAMGGVVVMRSRWRTRAGLELANDAAAGSYATVRESLAALARTGSWDLAGAVQVFNTDGHRAGAGGSSQVAEAAVRWRLGPGTSLTLRDKVVHLDGGDPGPASHPYLDHWYDVWRDTASLRLELRRARWRLTVTPYLNVGVHRLYDGFYSRDYVGGGVGEADVRLHRRVQLVVGAAAEGVGGVVKNRITGERPEVRGHSDLSLYGQVTVRPLDRLTLVVGGRELYSTGYGAVSLYRAGAQLDLWRSLGFHSRVARNFRQPTIRELYLPYPTANPDLKPEYALNWDAGLDWVDARFAASCSVFRTAANDLIKYFGVWPAAEVVNIDHVVIWGVEGRAGLRRLGPVSAFVTAAWQDVGRYTRQNPDLKLDFSVEASHCFGGHFVAAALTGEWVHGLYMADYGRQPMADAFVMDLALRYRRTLATRKLVVEPYLVLRNLLDRRYAYVADYPMPGFNVLAGLRLGL